MKRHRNRLADLATAYTAVVDEATEVETYEAEAPADMPSDWSGVVVVEGTPTGDGRLIERGALRWETSRENPILLRYVQEDVGAHDGAQVVGRIYSLERLESGEIFARGDFDTGSEVGREAMRQVAENLTRGVSVDLDDVSFEVRVAQDVLEGEMLVEDAADAGVEEEVEVDDEGRVTVVKIEKDAEMMVTTDARVRAATLVATPAFSEAYIGLEEAPESAEEDADGYSARAETPDSGESAVEAFTEDVLTAAAAPTEPPTSWFDNPNLTGPTALVVTDDGQVYGHVATWDTCHIGNPGGNGQCVMAPKSKTNYAYFHTGAVRTAEGKDVAVGHITMDTGHAKPKMNANAAAYHYDNTGATVADVRSGEDSHGIWVAGALRPGVTAEQVRALRSSPLSGDWRSVAGNLELVAALAVNVPGFPVPRPQGLVASGATASLTAAGMVPPTKVRRRDAGTSNVLSNSDLKYLKRLADRGRQAEKADMNEKVARAKAQMNRRKVESFRSRAKMKGD